MNDSSREGYADDWLPPDINEPPEFNPEGQRLKPQYPVDRPGWFAQATASAYKTPGPGPSAGVPKRELELSKIDKQIEDIRLALKQSPLRASQPAAAIKFSLAQIELSTAYLKEHV